MVKKVSTEGFGDTMRKRIVPNIDKHNYGPDSPIIGINHHESKIPLKNKRIFDA